MDKLDPVREALAQKDDKWEEWGFEMLEENLRKEHYILINQQSETRRGLQRLDYCMNAQLSPILKHRL